MKRNRILIVDDNPQNTAIVKRILGDRYLLAEASDGETALDVIWLFRPDIVLLDIMLPGIDGYEVCRRIRESQALPNTKVIMVTAKAMVDEKLEGYEAGTDDYVTKPFDGDELLAKVEVYLRLKTVEEHEALKTNLLTLVGHETRTPLTYVIGASESLKQSGLPEQEQALISMIHEGTSRISELISKILRYGEVCSGLETDLSQPCELGSAIDISISKLASKAGEKSVTVQRSGQKAPRVMGDGLQITEAFETIIDNAIEHSPPNETVTIHTTVEDDQVTVCVSDNGPGIPEDDLATFLDGFNVSDINHHTRGVGMSMAIVKAIIDAHDGTLHVDSKDGAGDNVFGPSADGWGGVPR